MRNQRTSLFLSLLVSLIACDSYLNHEFARVEAAKGYQSSSNDQPPPPFPERLRLMTYNIKFGGGRLNFFFDCLGKRSMIEESEVKDHLQGIAAKIRATDPDIVFLQEVDVRAKRSRYVNQVQWLLDHTDLRYAAYASQWRVNFIPSSGIGPMDSGNAILSRWPLRDAKRHSLPLFSHQDDLTRTFYLRRNLLEAQLEVEGRGMITLINAHLSAYSTDDTRLLQLQQLAAHVQDVAIRGPVLFGGDWNTLPPGTSKQHGFPDTYCKDEFVADDYRREADWLTPFYENYHPSLALKDYQANQTAYFSHSLNRTEPWNRKLDYLFATLPFVSGSHQTHQGTEAGEPDSNELSDHAPITAEWEVTL